MELSEMQKSAKNIRELPPAVGVPLHQKGIKISICKIIPSAPEHHNLEVRG
jgi:hypothetical protein